MLVHGEWLLTAERAALHCPTATAVIADLHLGYGDARRRSGEAVPDSGVEETIAALGALVLGHEVHRLVIAGDLFEDGRRGTFPDELLDWLRAARVELAGLVPGNHDRGLSRGMAGMPIFPHGVVLGAWRVVHGDAKLPTGPIVQGHEHPCFRWGSVTAPCFLVGPRRLVLPAFSADAAGGNVVGKRRWRGYRCGVVAGNEVLDFGDPSELGRRQRR